MSRAIKYFLIFLGTVISVAAGGYIVLILSIASAFGPSSSKAELIENYETKAVEIHAVQQWIQCQVPLNHQVYIEFDEEDKVRKLAIFAADSLVFQAWDLPVSSNETRRALRFLGWKTAVLQAAYEKLEKANCISVKSGEPCQIGFRRSGLGMYFYDVFTNPLSESLKAVYDDSCHYLPYKSRVVLEHQGGAAGPQCFPD